MGFKELDSRILIDLQNNNTKECLYIIKNNKEIVKKYLGDNADLKTVQSFVKHLNFIILYTNPSLSFIQTMLNLPYFNRVHSVFLNSEILIEACKLGRRETLEWLLTLDINPHVRDSHGMTALMHASKNPNLLFVLKKLISTTTPVPHSDDKKDNDNNNEINNSKNVDDVSDNTNQKKIENNNSKNDNVDDNKDQDNSANNENLKDIENNTKNDYKDDDSKNQENNFSNNNDDYSCLNEEDNQGHNALFHSARNVIALKELLKTDIDVNHFNKNHETVLIYCCKNNYFESIQYLTQHPNIDVNLTDQKEWTAAMYLAEKGRKTELFELNQLNKCDYEYHNSKHESVLSVTLKKLYWPEDEEEEEDGETCSTISTDTFFSDNASSVYSKSSSFSYYNPPRYSSHSSYRDSLISTCVNSSASSYQTYIYMLTHFIYRGFDFNLPMDDYGNTPLMLLIIVGDIQTLHFVLNCSEKVDLSAKNKFGENAYSLALKYNLPKGILDDMKNHLTFDYDYYDEYTGNNLFLLSAMIEPLMIETLLQRDPEAIHSVNPNGKENALILATKLHRKDSVKILLQHSIPIDYQDTLGNTALYYAIDVNDIHIVKLLRSHDADMNLKNKAGVSPMDYAKSLGYDYMLNILKEERKSVLFSFPSPPTSPKMNQEFSNLTTTVGDKNKEGKEDSKSSNEKRKSQSEKFTENNKNKKEEVKDFYFQFLEEDDQSEEKVKETSEYIQPHVGPYYDNLKMDLPFELVIAERKVYNEEINRSRSLLKLCDRNSSIESYDNDYEYNYNNISNI